MLAVFKQSIPRIEEGTLGFHTRNTMLTLVLLDIPLIPIKGDFVHSVCSVSHYKM